MLTALLSRPPGSVGGNRTTALRWARILRAEGWSVRRAPSHRGGPVHLVVALHAVRTRPEVERLMDLHPDARLVVACSGTDINEDLAAAQPLLDRADRIVVLQEAALAALTPAQVGRARVIHQSSAPRRSGAAPDGPRTLFAVVANVRAVKDPLLPAAATRLLPGSSGARVVHVGAGLDEALTERVRRESASNPRYEWRGPVPRAEALELLARAAAVVIPSRSEGGANVVTEALGQGCPILATRVPGNTGLLGDDHPGLFAPGDAADLARLMERVEGDAAFHGALVRRSAEQAHLASPERETRAWRELLAELVP